MPSKLVVVLSLVVCLLLASPVLSADKDELQGTWILESWEMRGKKLDIPKGRVITFSHDEFSAKVDGKKQSSSYKTDGSESPKHMDITTEGPDEKGMISLAIYKIEGDTLTICAGGGIVDKQEPRPTAFDSKQGSLMILK